MKRNDEAIHMMTLVFWPKIPASDSESVGTTAASTAASVAVAALAASARGGSRTAMKPNAAKTKPAAA